MIRVLVVDDSAVMRKLLTAELAREPDIEIVGTAVDPYDARNRILQLAPDVITLDIEMPRMDGLSFLARLMKYHPVPVVIVSSVTPKHSEIALRALDLGAIEVIAKPATPDRVGELGGELARAVRAAAAARMPAAIGAAQTDAAPAPAPARAPVVAALPAASAAAQQRLIVIGASTGGPVALEHILSLLPPNSPAVLVVQHMPAGFTAALARRLDARCAITVREAADGDVVAAGSALIAPGGMHMVLVRRGAKLRVAVRTGPPVHYQRPSVDVLFHSVAQVAGDAAVGVLLTGMGADGASGLRALRDAGAHTIAQDEQTCTVFSMPREAIRFDGVCEVLPLQRIAAAALRAVPQVVR